MNGALLENYVISEVMKSYQNEGVNPSLYYYRDKDNKEIDLVIDRDDKLYPIEIKKTAMPDKNWVKVFSVLTSQASILGTGALLCTVETLGAFDKDNLIVPAYGTAFSFCYEEFDAYVLKTGKYLKFFLDRLEKLFILSIRLI